MNVEINLVTNVITNFIQKRYKLDTMVMQLVSTTLINILGFIHEKFKKLNLSGVIDSQIENFDSDSVDVSSIINKLYYLFVIGGTMWACFKYKVVGKFTKNIKKVYKYYLNKRKDKEVVKKLEVVKKPTKSITNVEKKPKKISYKINLNNIQSAIINMNKFMKLHPSYFNTNVSQKLVNYIGDSLYPIYDDRVYFNDEIHEVDGFIETKFNCVTDEKGNNFNNYDMSLSIRKLESNKKCYIKQISDYINYQMKHGNNVKLNYYKILGKSMVVHTFYEEDISKWYTDIQTLKDSFFSPHKDYIFSVMDQKAKGNSLTSCWNNLILHGPPGVGKSSVIYRIATILKMSILSVDLSLYIDKKKELYSLFHGQEFCLPEVENSKHSSKNCIIILEEFDNCINKLLELENIYKFKNLVMKEHFASKELELNKKIKKISETIDKKSIKFKNVKETNRPKNLENMGFEESQRHLMEEEDNVLAMNDVMNDARNNMVETRKYDNSLSMVNLDLNSMIKNINEDNKSDILRFSDLLELFQGPIPIKDRLIIATTNHYEKIKDTLLYRLYSGRVD